MKRPKQFFIFLIILYSCNNSVDNKLHGDYREYLNDSIVTDYKISDDTIEYKYCRMNWFYKIPYYYKDSTYFCKDSSKCIRYNDPCIFKVISLQDSIRLTINSGGKNSKLVKLSHYNNRLPIRIKFDLIDSIYNNKENSAIGLGDSDFELNLDGTYKFYVSNKVYNGKISANLLKELVYNFNLIDTTDKKLTFHYFEIHLLEFYYRLDFIYDNKTESYYISNRQPIQFNRLTLCIEKVWYNILNQSGRVIK